METGSYSFILPIDGEAQLILECVPSSSTQGSSFEEGVDSGTTIRTQATSTQSNRTAEPRTGELEGIAGKKTKQEQWNSEQIGDFVRKLGFMDTKKEGGEKIKHFRHISSVSP